MLEADRAEPVEERSGVDGACAADGKRGVESRGKASREGGQCTCAPALRWKLPMIETGAARVDQCAKQITAAP